MVLRSGPKARLPAGFLAPLLRCNPTAPCAARLPSRSMRKSADPNTMALCACCMLVVLAFAAVARFGSSVKSTLPPKSHDGSAPCFGLCLLALLPLPLCLLSCCRHPCLRLLLSCGGIGLAAPCVASGFSSFAGKPSPSPGNLSLRLVSHSFPLNRARSCPRASSVPTTDFPGHSAWIAMPVPLMLLDSRSSYMACQRASLRLLALLLRPSRNPHTRSRLRLEALVGQCWHTPVAHQQSKTDQQMSFRNR
jgi:hypothetical protein